MLTQPSNHSVAESLNRLEADLRSKHVTVFARIDHAAGAASVSMPLRPTELLIFGNPKAGTPLMQSNQAIGIDLPLKVLAWQDASGQVWLTYNDPRWLARRHAVGSDVASSVDALASAVAGLVKTAAG
ncbi:MAG TPA: DUF302 domain-containing protein [Steroidobacteraceae bacterium]